MISMIADGHAGQARQLIVDTDAMEALEPLWHVAREELGEDIGPLPTEVMDAVTEVRRRVAEARE